MTILPPPVPDNVVADGGLWPGHTPSRWWAWVGDLDAADAAALSSTWRSLLREHPASVVIDLSAVTFLDCSILSVLVRANRDPLTRLLLHGVPTWVEALLQVTGLGAAFARALPGDLPARPELSGVSSRIGAERAGFA